MVHLPPSLDAAISTLEAAGLNRWGVAPVAAYDTAALEGLRSAEIAPWARSILVFASGGKMLWEGMLEAIGADASRLSGEAHPLDAHVARVIDSTSFPDVRHRWFLATATAPVQLDFRTLAVLAGVGAPSRMGLVIDPEMGLWMGLRAACFVDQPLEPSPPTPDVCEGCPAPCISACPAGALESGQWAVRTCAAYHRSSTDCAQTCHSRVACPVGAEHRYSDLQRAYHYNRATGRAALREALGIPAGSDPYEGIGPHWGDWDAG